MHRRERADARQHHARGLSDHLRIVGEPSVGPDARQPLLGRPQVADAVVEHRDQRRPHRVPLVDGTPRPSMRTALRRQRATPLNVASMT